MGSKARGGTEGLRWDRRLEVGPKARGGTEG